MGILRTISKAIGKFILTFFLTSLIFTIGLVQFTGYENMKIVFSDIAGSQIGGTMTEEELERLQQTLLELCEGEESVELQILESEDPITIDCNEVRAVAEDSERSIVNVIGDVSSTTFFDEIYYKEYECNFFECIQTGQFTIIASAHGHSFFNQIQIYLAIGVAAGIIIVLIATENWSDRLKGVGWALVFTGISYLFLTFGKGAIVMTLPSEEQAGINVMSMVDKMIEPMMNGFLIALIIGIVVTASGYALAYREKRKIPERKIENRKRIVD